MIPGPSTVTSAADVRASREADGAVVLAIGGHLDADSMGRLWRRAMSLAADAGAGRLVVDASAVEYCDGSGAALFVALQRQQRAGGGSFEIRGLRESFRRLLALVEPSEASEAASAEQPRPPGLVERVGRGALEVMAELRVLVVFVGRLAAALVSALADPGRIRAKDAFRVAEDAGIGAIPIVALVGFLLGLILAFQSAISMKRFGAEIFVADLLGLSLLRELGPLMAAILLTARSGSAFAAELGTMKVNEEVDALTTMGLEPVRFLVVPRVLAGVSVVPVLAMLMNLFGLMGGALVMVSLGFPVVTYVNRVADAASVADFLGGLFKAFVFGIVVTGVGCLRGLQTGTGAGAVGSSATSAVVSGIILIALVDGVFAVVFYVLDW